MFKKIFVGLVVLIGFGLSSTYAQYSDPKVMQQKVDQAKSQPQSNQSQPKATATTTSSSCTTAGVSFAGNGVSTKTCTTTNNDGSKTTTITSCTTKGVDVGLVKTVKEDCKTATVTTPASSSSPGKK